MLLMMIVLTLVAVALLVCLLSLTGEVRGIRSELRLLPELRKLLESAVAAREEPSPSGAFVTLAASGHGHYSAPFGAGIFVVWEWQDGKWRLPPGAFPVGADPGAPPVHPGAFPGDHVKIWITRK